MWELLKNELYQTKAKVLCFIETKTVIRYENWNHRSNRSTGPTGCRILKNKVSPSDIVALVRDPAKAEGMGVEARPFDYNKPEALEAQLKGIDRLLLISGSEIGKRVQTRKRDQSRESCRYQIIGLYKFVKS